MISVCQAQGSLLKLQNRILFKRNHFSDTHSHFLDDWQCGCQRQSVGSVWPSPAQVPCGDSLLEASLKAPRSQHGELSIRLNQLFQLFGVQATGCSSKGSIVHAYSNRHSFVWQPVRIFAKDETLLPQARILINSKTKNWISRSIVRKRENTHQALFNRSVYDTGVNHQTAIR